MSTAAARSLLLLGGGRSDGEGVSEGGDVEFGGCRKPATRGLARTACYDFTYLIYA